MSIIATPKISIIIPVYNAGPFLKKRIDSLLTQTLKEIEIILVLDLPTDGSDKIAEEYAKKDDRIILIYNHQNIHVGLSRNEGLKKATGEYINFADHDDYCNLDMFQKLYEKAKEVDADILASDYYTESSQETCYMGFPDGLSDSELKKNAFSQLIRGLRKDRKKRSLKNCSAVWNHIFKKDFLIKNNILFQDNRKITFEDRIFLIESYHYARKISCLPEAFYYHVTNPTSAGHNYAYRSVDLITNYLIYVHHFLCTQQLLEQVSLNYSDSVLKNLYTSFRNEVKHRSFLKAFNELHKIRNNQAIQEALRHFFTLKNFHHLGQYRITKLCFLVLVLLFSYKRNKHRK